MYRHRSAWMCGCIVVSLATVVWAASGSQPAIASSRPAAAQPADAKVGYVKGNNVYVRSGSNANYYAVTKLNRGDELRVVREEYGWLEIEPPAGTYSLVEKTYVDKVDDKSGTVNGPTWTYAGSNLDNKRYAKQVKLDKGAKVHVLGETQDGALYKIDPPAGATLWIKADLVDRSGTAIASGEPKKPALETVPPGKLSLAEATTPVAARAAEAPKVAPRTTVAAPKPEPKDDKFQLQFSAIEAEVAAEMAKPLGERNLEPIIAKLEPIAAQSEDDIAQIYAKTRIDQLREHLELVKAVQEIRNLRDSAIENANQEAKRRQSIKAAEPSPMDDVVLRGEIRVSGIYTGTLNMPKRWRVVDEKGGKTLAYIEVPDGYRQLKDTIPPVPVYTVREILVLDPASGLPQGTSRLASPAPRMVDAPASQPAAASPETQPESTTTP
jgi:uncharacterized protein YgiM (DUF1202 family)